MKLFKKRGFLFRKKIVPEQEKRLNVSSSEGFTLIELLIVITIIAILSMIGLIAYGTFLKNSRDAKRQSDLKFIQSALEEYRADQIYYPSGSLPFGSSLTNCTGVYPTCSGSATRTYLNIIPSDPKVSPQYSYTAISPSGCDNNSNKCTSYCLYAFLENLPSPKTEDSVNCPTNNTYNYAVTKP